MMKKILMTLGALIAPLLLAAQTVIDMPLHYSMRYVKEHMLLRNGDDFNVVDTDIEWPEVMGQHRAEALGRLIGQRLFGIESANLDSTYSVFKAELGQPVASQLETLPDDRRFCYITATCRVRAYNPGRWISFEIDYEAKPETLSTVKPKREQSYITYDIARQRAFTSNQMLRQASFSGGDLDPAFYEAVFAPLSDDDFYEMTASSIDGVWLEPSGQTVGLHITCATPDRMLSYDVGVAYEQMRFLLSKDARRMVDKPAPQATPEIVYAPQTWQGDTIYNKVEVMPQFSGGPDALKAYVDSYAKTVESRSGKSTVSFVVDKEGWAKDIRIIDALGPEVDRKMVDLVRMMPRFEPGKHGGKPACVRMSVRIRYQ